MTTSEACQLVVDLIRQLAVVRAERDAYREIVSVALTQLHEKNRELERERTARHRLLEEFRALREKGRNKPVRDRKNEPLGEGGTQGARAARTRRWCERT